MNETAIKLKLMTARLLLRDLRMMKKRSASEKKNKNVVNETIRRNQRT